MKKKVIKSLSFDNQNQIFDDTSQVFWRGRACFLSGVIGCIVDQIEEQDPHQRFFAF